MKGFNFGLKNKFTLLIAAIIFICVAFVSYDYYLKAKNSLMAYLRADLKDTAMSLALSIDAREIEKVLAGNEKSLAYWNLKRKLNRFTLMGDGKINEAYVVVPTRKKDVWKFVADSELKDQSKMAQLNEEYDVSKFEEMKKGFASPAADKEITQDKWGRWLSGYAPIYDKKARPVAVFGIDMRAAEVEKLKRETLNSALLYLFIGAILSLVLGRFGAHTVTRPIVALVTGVKGIKEKNYGARIDIRRNDEIGELVATFNEMSIKLSEVDKIKSDFLAVISHELYTPLTPILDGAELLKTTSQNPEDVKRVMDLIERQAHKMRNLIDEILDFSWLDVKDLKLNLEPVNAELAAKEAAGQMKPEIQKKEIDFTLECESGLPIIKADKKRFAHVIKILIDNAVKSTPEKGKISLKMAKIEKGLEVTVKDTGIGIAPEKIGKLFESFYQVEDHMTRARGGLGLGLAIAKRIVEAHGGAIRAESVGPGKGSCFTFTLPIA